MARPVRIEFAGAVYQVTFRGNARTWLMVPYGVKFDFLIFVA